MKAKALTGILVIGLFIFVATLATNSYASQDITITEGNNNSLDVIDQQFKSLGITLHAGTEYTSQSKPTPISLQHCKSLVYRTLKSLPQEPVQHLKNLTLYFSDTGRRGLGGGDTIILRCQNVTDEELVAVLVHEMGHIMDTGVMQSHADSDTAPLSGSAEEGMFMDGNVRIKNDDPSIVFYSISFKDSTTLRDDVSSLDFVSGYAMSDPFEDFAESYAYYILHGNDFRSLAKKIINSNKNINFYNKKFLIIRNILMVIKAPRLSVRASATMMLQSCHIVLISFSESDTLRKGFHILGYRGFSRALVYLRAFGTSCKFGRCFG